MREGHSVRDLLPGFALGCLDPEEEGQVREHLPGCPECRAELAALQSVADSLALCVPAVEPPPALEEKVMRRIGARPRLVPRPGRKRLWPALGAVAAVLIAVLAVGNILQAARVLPGRGRAARSGLVTVALAGTDRARDAYGTMVLDSDDNRGILAVRGLPSLDAGHQYQLWLIKDGQRASGGVFSVDADGYGALLVTVPATFTGVRSFGISIEPAGGSPAPTGAKVMGGTL